MSERWEKPYAVVVGIDFREQGAEALEWAFEHCSRRPHSEIHAVHVGRSFGEFVVLDAPEPTVYGLSLQEASERLSQYVHERRRSFEARVGRPACGRCVIHIRSEVPAEEIAALASEVRADLIVVGTHGRRGMRRLVLGSVAESVVRLAKCSVLVVRPGGFLRTRPRPGAPETKGAVLRLVRGAQPSR